MYNIRGCTKTGLWLKVEASRRQNDPRKPGKVPASMVRLRSKSGQHGDAERVSSGARRRMSESSGRRVWGQRPGQPGSRCALSIYVYLMSES